MGVDHTATKAMQAPPLRLVLKEDDLTEERIAARLPWSNGSRAHAGSRLEEKDGHHLALLLAAARQQRRGPDFCGAGEVRLAYVAVCGEFDRQPRSRATVHRMLRGLETTGVIEIIVREPGQSSMVYVLDAARVARKARDEGAAKPRTTAQLRAAFEKWDNEHNVCLVLEGQPGECEEIEALWNIAREGIERLEQRGV